MTPSAAAAEASELKRPPISTTPDEAWFNVLRPGGFNLLHTHPGSSYSGVLYVSDGGGSWSSTGDGSEIKTDYSGRLALVPHANAPATGVPADQQPHLAFDRRSAAATI